MRGLRRKLSFANVTSILALFVALATGGAYAADELLGKDDVASKHIKNGGVKTKDLKDNAVTSPKVANGSLLGEDFAAGQLPQGPQGPQGGRGEQGLQGLQGLQGPAGATKVARRTSGLTLVQPDTSATATANCNAGEVATGGGHDYSSVSAADMHVIQSDAVLTAGVPTGWVVRVSNVDNNGDNAGTVDFYARVICASP